MPLLRDGRLAIVLNSERTQQNRTNKREHSTDGQNIQIQGKVHEVLPAVCRGDKSSRVRSFPEMRNIVRCQINRMAVIE